MTKQFCQQCILNIPSYKAPAGLEALAQKYEKALLTVEPILFKFPEDYSSKKRLVKETKELNAPILLSLKDNANVYAIFIRRQGDVEWQIKYVGQRKREWIRERIVQHLITKDRRTGAKLEKVRESVSLNKEIGLTFIKVEPDSLRRYVEETIIKNNKSKLEWNTHG